MGPAATTALVTLIGTDYRRVIFLTQREYGLHYQPAIWRNVNSVNSVVL
jgi:hypothetical protein